MNNINISNTWVFVSHSNKDFDRIIYVRNKLEALHYKPLLFFLKCLEDDKEIFELIKREIKARDRFLLCDSKNSRESEWVKKEKEFIISLNRPYEIINLDGTEEEMNESIERFNKRSTMYVWSTDSEIEKKIIGRLIDKSFKVHALPNTFFNDYHYYKTGSPELVHPDFITADINGYVLLIISRELTKKEMTTLEMTAGRLFHDNDFKCLRVYVIASNETRRKEIALANKDLLYPIYYGEGIHARYYVNKDDNTLAEKVVNDILDLDTWHFHSSINKIPRNFFLRLHEWIYNKDKEIYEIISTLYYPISYIQIGKEISWLDEKGSSSSSCGKYIITEFTQDIINYQCHYKNKKYLNGKICINSSDNCVLEGKEFSYRLEITSMSNILQFAPNFNVSR